MRELAARFPGRVAVRIGYDEALSHRMFAGGDAVLVPIRFEPCGLTQMYGLALWHAAGGVAVGGLADTVIGANPATLAAGVATGIDVPSGRCAGLRAGAAAAAGAARRAEALGEGAAQRDDAPGGLGDLGRRLCRALRRAARVTPQAVSLPGASAGPCRQRRAAPGRWAQALTGDGVNFAVFSAHAERIELCLFSPRWPQGDWRGCRFTERDGDIWHMHVGGPEPWHASTASARMGPMRPKQGHRFNPHKLLIDPYARALEGRLHWSDALMGYKIGSPRGDLSLRHPRQRLCRAEIGGGRPVLQLGQRSGPAHAAAPRR